MRELSGLLEMNMLRKGYGYEERERWEQGTVQRGQEREDGGSERERVKYTFTHGFMREMVSVAHARLAEEGVGGEAVRSAL